MNLILLGPPGAGKGTQAKLMLQKYALPQISTGDILREAIRLGTELGKRVEPLLANGKLVPDDLVIQIIEERLKRDDATQGFVLDGFPRTLPQAEALEAQLKRAGKKIDRVVSLEVDEAAIVGRMGGRRSCPKDGSVFHLVNSPPKVTGKCDKCGADLVQRPDDVPEKVQNRLRIYAQDTAPLKDFYEKRNLLSRIDGMGNAEQVFGAISDALGKK
ncbi:MAG: adenylate kinase [Myxococcaceae bacterium]|nr:adenylate kinase [Myxococcaceae bacterium]